MDETTTTETPILNTADRHATVQQAHTLAMGRLRELQTKSEFEVLTESEVDEMVRLERQTANLGGVLERLKGEMLRDQARIDIEAVVGSWSDLVQAKVGAYQSFALAVGRLEQAIAGVLQVHLAQEQEVLKLPRFIQERLNFPSDADLARRIAGRLPAQMAGLVAARGLTKGELDQIKDADPGARELNPRMIARFYEENDKWMKKY